MMLGVLKTCGHYFHLNCICTWLNSSPHSRCPICRGDTELSSDTAVRAISYHDLKKVIKSQNDSQRTKSSITKGELNPAFCEEHTRATDSNPRSATGRCDICNELYEDNPNFMVVGYISQCGHYFHYHCIQSLNTCPTCQTSESQSPSEGLDIQMALLSDVM